MEVQVTFDLRSKLWWSCSYVSIKVFVFSLWVRWRINHQDYIYWLHLFWLNANHHQIWLTLEAVLMSLTSDHWPRHRSQIFTASWLGQWTVETEMSTKVCEHSQWPEKASTSVFTSLKGLLALWQSKSMKVSATQFYIYTCTMFNCTLII